MEERRGKVGTGVKQGGHSPLCSAAAVASEAHGTAHKHPVAPVEGLIYKGDSWDTRAHGQRQPISLHHPLSLLVISTLLSPRTSLWIFKP